jgi:UDP-N-acetylmuramate: L-alanyl-gamma-D-glutamyl-meso-diaminopimelate ligase
MRLTIDGLRRKVDHLPVAPGAPRPRILAVFEPRSNTMKLGSMKAQLPWSLEEADLAFCHAANLGWDAAQALAPMGAKAKVADSLDVLVRDVVAASRPGDHVLVMSNGGFGGVHEKLLAALAAVRR